MELIINKVNKKENRIFSKIEYEGKEYELFFETNDEYSNFLCDANANAFLVALLPFAVKHNYDVIVKDKISSKLYYQLSTYLLPLLCNEFKKKEIKIECKLTDSVFNGKGVGASISCGVDSFYTLLKHKALKDNSYNITHLCFFNAGSNGEYGGEEAQLLYNDRIKHIKEFCKEYKYPLVTVDSNMNELIMMNHEKRHTFTTLACVYALEKLFSTYYFASGLGFNGSHIDENDTAFYDILNVHCLSNENITFYCSGLETTRMKKVEFIANYKETYDWLNVCVGTQWKNDCRCHKCIRTMTALESIRKLDCYKNVFDLDYYNKNRIVILSKIIKHNRDRLQRAFLNEIIQNYKKNGINIPLTSYILSFVVTKKDIINVMKKILPNFIIDKYKKKKNSIDDGWL